jgi:tRNA threonylcarbamoyladenosine biosynthesis protein TsaB
MICMVIDTSLDYCSVGIKYNDNLIIESILAKSKQAEILPQMVADLCAAVKINPKQITKIAVTTGPGSFTGVRVGLAFAKGLAIAINCELIGISTLEVLAQSIAHEKTIAIIQQMGSNFCAIYNNKKIAHAPFRVDDMAMFEQFNSDWVITAPNLVNELKNREITLQDGLNIAKFMELALEKDAISNPPEPLYLRGADAKIWQGSQYV